MEKYLNTEQAKLVLEALKFGQSSLVIARIIPGAIPRDTVDSAISVMEAEDVKGDDDSLAKAMAIHAGWNAWDTATNCANTLSGNDPEDERNFYRELANIARAALSAPAAPSEPQQNSSSKNSTDWTDEDQREQEYFDRHPEVSAAPAAEQPAPTGDPEQDALLSNQVDAWRKEVARLNDLIACAVGMPELPQVELPLLPWHNLEWSHDFEAWIEAKDGSDVAMAFGEHARAYAAAAVAREREACATACDLIEEGEACTNAKKPPEMRLPSEFGAEMCAAAIRNRDKGN